MLLINQLRVNEFNRRVARFKYIQKQQLQARAIRSEQPLHVVYLLGHVSVCGGVKIIFEHANELSKLGLRVSLLSHFPKPDWFAIEANYLQVPFGIELARGIPQDTDIIVATYWDQLSACVEAGIAPVVYFEQGDFHLWDWDKVDAAKKDLIYRMYQLPSRIITCSETGARKIQENFHRQALVFHNALNEQIFYPKSSNPQEVYVLAVGSEHTPFKRIPDIWQACQRVQEQGYDVQFKWITQNPPTKPLGKVIVNPPQQQLGEEYRQSYIYVCASEYETFPLPPLEAMSCGTPVITTPNDGVKVYGVDGENCLFFQPGNISELAEKIILLLENQQLYQQLQQKGYQTAAQFKWSQIIPHLRDFYAEVARYQPVAVNSLTDWVKLVPEEFSPEEQQTINCFLKGTAADLLYLPFTFRIGDELTVIRWYPAYQRISSLSGQSDYLYCGFKSRPWEKYPYPAAVKAVLEKEYSVALEKFKQHLSLTTHYQEVAVLLRWIIWCLIKAKRLAEAQHLLKKGYQAYSSYTDIYYLYSLLLRETGSSSKELQTLHNTMKVLGSGVAFPEFIDTFKSVHTPTIS
ncbi:glycosyltransferase family 4 protein [Desulforamulus ferrireducens]|uniref:Group 1 glycosyl transferase n=1 Tax=Desulforamulus ferrireducens TaxID=1833852 RepID=A0A1S6IVL3_9FIRM|nr:glycosyltransferase family 4 protein [Desulforamulus ferrireducens]AQS58821.1 group 1 glycosyl transferase [Desulforamulus ferrireducens]